jgi:apolipoprotein N-acyltransferase
LSPDFLAIFLSLFPRRSDVSKIYTNPRFWLRTAAGLGLAVLSAVLLTLAFPPYNLGLLIWVGFIPILVAQYRLLPTKISSLASAIAIGSWLGVLLVPMFGGKSFLMAAIPLLTGLLVFFVDKNKRLFHERTSYRLFILEGVAGWVGLEMIRSFIPALGTWLFVGYPLWNQPWLIQPLSVFGIYGLDLLIMLSNYALALVLFVKIDKKWKPEDTPQIIRRPAHVGLLTFGILMAAWLALSLSLYISAPRDSATVRLAAIQPNLPRAAHRDTLTPTGQRLSILSDQTRAAAAQGVQVVVWPEMALGFDPQVEHTQELQSLAAETQTYIVIGYVLDNDAGFRNEAAILAPSGEFLGIYGKTHPAVFSGEPGTISRGVYPVYETPLGKLATMICFDADFTDVARRLSRQGAQIIAVPSLFGRSIAQMPYTQIVLRAIENRTAMVMADVAYNSAIVDPYGHILELSITPGGEETTLIADVPSGTGRTVYSKLGNWLGWLSLGGLVFFAIFMPVRLRKP